ncbi:hypothetical protein T03_9674 [Trichinella britovi]|uniref:Uncharacterized protein n=1 Tax=Trichinella britovi TaxID=45882 RepID=A0A0V1AIM6_TRIBR|nr:hypothetical protein T03_9674 [Trichinella britovi]
MQIVFCIQFHELYHEFSWLVISLVAVAERPELQFPS